MIDLNDFVDTGFSQKHLEAWIKHKAPDFWKFAHPYRFGDSEKWYNPAEMACLHLITITRVIHNFHTLGADDMDDGTATLSDYAGFSVLPSPPPTYFVDPDLLRAATHTLPPRGIPWKEFELPHKAMILLLPRSNRIIDPSGNNLKGLLFFSFDNGEEIIHKKARLPPGFPVVRFNAGCVGIVGLAGGRSYSHNLNYEDFPTTDACHLPEKQLITPEMEVVELLEHMEHQLPSGHELAAVPENHRLFGAEIMKLAVNLIFIMSARPELVKILPGKTRPAKNGKAAIVRPPVLGLGYKIQGGVSVQSGEPDKHHPKMRLHWRRGHYRDQPCGKGRNHRKIIWIEPYIAGGD